MDAPAPATAVAGGPTGQLRADLKSLLGLAGPVVLSRLGVMTMGLTDAIVVGRYSATQLGYHALAWTPTSIVLMVVMGLLTGVQVMTSRAIGEGRRAGAGAVLRRGMVYSVWLGLGATVFLIALGPMFLHSIGLPRDLADGSTAPLIVFSLSLTPYALSTAVSVWLEALSKPNAAMILMWLANLVNLAVDLVLVPGHFGAPALGAVGGGCATLASRIVLLAALLVYVARMPEARGLGVFDKPPREPAAEAEQRRIGFGAGASNFSEVAAFAGMNIVAGWQGGLTVAAWTIVLNVTAMIFMIPLGIAVATSVLVGVAYGARDARRLRRAAGLGMGVTVAFGVAVGLAVWPARYAIAGLYTESAVVIPMTANALVLCCLYFVPDGLQVVAAQSLRARGDVWLPSVTHLISYIGVMAPLAWFLALPMHLGLEGQVLAVIVASFLSAGLLLARFAILTRRGI